MRTINLIDNNNNRHYHHAVSFLQTPFPLRSLQLILFIWALHRTQKNNNNGELQN